ncbi:hypothetical protein GPROT1_00544 [Gammaproteobacteria bacterium]|nr:hypothetical protein GPROT1_00544 [Gammaproteobacteria bacterium]
MSSTTIIQPEVTDVASQTYEKPAIVHELKLETRAGSPLGGDPLIDPLGLDPSQPQ